ncbi:MAG: hypothetical protein U0805_00925 [Pirellulales bacterium]
MPHYDRHAADSFAPDARAKADARSDDLANAAAALRETEVEAAESEGESRPPRAGEIRNAEDQQ